MNTDQLLREAFLDHERLSPDTEETLRNIHARIGGRRNAVRVDSRRRIVAGVAGVVVAVTVIGIVAASAIIKAGNRPTPSEQTTSRPGAARTPKFFLSIAPGYLPPGTVADKAEGTAVTGQQFRSYTISSGGHNTLVGLNLARTRAEAVSGSPGPGTVVRTPGGTARQWSTTRNSVILITRPDGFVTVTITITGDSTPASTIGALARKVADHLQYRRHDELTPDFRLGYLPDKARIQALTITMLAGHPRRTDWSVSTPAASKAHVAVSVYVDDQPNLKGPAGQPVQGHATRIGTGFQYPSLYVIDAVGREAIFLNGAPGTGLPELYQIADGLVLPR